MSKFQGIFDQSDGPKQEETAHEAMPVTVLPSEPVASAQRMGRPGGKRSDPQYVQVSAYVRRDIYRDVKIQLLMEGQGREFSELVDALLQDWLNRA